MGPLKQGLGDRDLRFPLLTNWPAGWYVQQVDNFYFDCTSDQNLENLLECGFGRSKSATGFIEKDGRLLLFWNCSSYPITATPFPTPLAPKEVYPLVAKWLEGKKPSEPKPSLDGHCSVGFRVWNGPFTPDGKDQDRACRFLYGYSLILAIEPVWAMYHK
jgi:hypothetical protein